MKEHIEPTPLYAQGFFIVDSSGVFNQLVIFDYWDPSGYYKKIAGDEDLLREELEKIKSNMQYFLDQERLMINGEEARPLVKHVSLGFRGKEEIPYLFFHIVFKGEIVDGENVYEDYFEEEVAEYDYVVTWIFPPGARVVVADVGVEYNLLENRRVLVYHVKAGTRVRGYEKIVFELSRNR